MEEILKQILTEIRELKTSQAKVDQKVDSLGERIDAHDRSNREEFRKLDKKLDGITEVVAKTMEDITDLKGKIENQDTEPKVLKGGK